MNFVPLLVGLELGGYTSSALGDNCAWINYAMDVLVVEVNFIKNIARCSNDFGKILKSNNDVMATLL